MNNAGNRYLQPDSRSAGLYRRALQVMPGGNTRTTVFTEPYPFYAVEGRGCTVVDADGEARLDFLNNYTSLIHGHGHPEVVAAATAQIQRCICVASPTEAEIALAEDLVRRIPSVEHVRFANSGSEAMMLAMQIARAYTGRAKIAKIEGAYHGTYDHAMVSVTLSPEEGGPAAEPRSVASNRGLSPRVADEVVVLPFNDAQAAARLLDRHGMHLAAVVIDVLPNRVGLMEPDPAWLRVVQEATRGHGALLIVDEVITFRLAPGGAQTLYGITPDLTALGKIIGGGFPVGAVGGRAEVMAVCDPRGGRPRVPHGGTFNANAVTMAAGVAAMRLLTPEVYARLDRLGERLRRGAADAFRAAGVEGQVAGRGSLFRLHMVGGTLRDYRSTYPDARRKALMAALYRNLLANGIVISQTGLGCLSTPMGEAEVDRFVEALEASLRTLPAEAPAAD